MFVFDDVTKLSIGDVQTIMKSVDTNQWAMALNSPLNYAAVRW